MLLKSKTKNITRFIYKNLEAFLWIVALAYLAIINPFSSDHLNMCVFNAVGFENCPGCGIGRSISSVLHGDIAHSLEMHPLGIFALVIIVLRIVTIFYKNYKLNKTLLEVYNG